MRMLREADFPALWFNVDKASLEGHKWTLRYEALRFCGGVMAAVGTICPLWIAGADFAAIIIFLGFFIAFLSELFAWIHKADEKWYNGRALAESVKTLVWRYSVGADPFQLELGDEQAQKIFSERVGRIIEEASEQIVIGTSDPLITEGMSALRGCSFKDRRNAYIEGRTKEQHKWYAEKAQFNRRRAVGWKLVLGGVEVVALALAAMRIFGGWNIDFAGLMAAVIASAGGWIAVKQFSLLATAYSVAEKELVIQVDKLRTVSEDDWPLVAADAEEAISREHTMWLASRTGKPPKV